MTELDLSYITPRVIAMGAPYDAPPVGTGIGKNEAPRVAEFLARRHGCHFRVFDLTLERAYSANTFTEAVARETSGKAPLSEQPIVVRRGFADHHAAPLRFLFPLLDEIDRYLAEDSQNVAVLHCMAGRGRTGLVVCAFLLYSGTAATADAALAMFSNARGQPLRTPSQRRFISYVQRFLRDIAHIPAGVPVSSAMSPSLLPLRVPEPPVVLRDIELQMAPDNLRIFIELVQLLPPHKRLIARSFEVIDGKARVGHVLNGDFMIRGLQISPKEDPIPMVFRASLHTLFLPSPGQIVLHRADIDGGFTGGFYDDRFGPDFSITVSTADADSFFRSKL